MKTYPPIQPTPEEYELEVKKILDAASGGLSEYDSRHREILAGVDGEFEIDISVRFSALGADFLMLVECKRYKNPVGREKVQALHSKMQSIGAQKGIMFSTGGFQSGAIEFAEVHGIALVEFVDGRTIWMRKSVDDDDGPTPWSKVPDYIPRIAGTLINGSTRSLTTVDHADGLRKYLQAK